MNGLILLLLALQIGPAPAPSGARIFAETCSAPYCHGAGGAAGRAPALAGRGFTREQLRDTVLNGRPQRGMPAFESKLDARALDAVVAYVMSLSPAGSARTEPGAAARAPVLSAEAKLGKELFYDSARLPSCGTCHAVNDVGGAIGAAIRRVTFTAEGLQKVSVSGVVTVNPPEGGAFPGLRLESPAGTVRVVDLSAELPVVRTFRAGEAKVTPGADWNHALVVRRYSGPELREIVAWLRAVLPG